MILKKVNKCLLWAITGKGAGLGWSMLTNSGLADQPALVNPGHSCRMAWGSAQPWGQWKWELPMVKVMCSYHHRTWRGVHHGLGIRTHKNTSNFTDLCSLQKCTMKYTMHIWMEAGSRFPQHVCGFKVVSCAISSCPVFKKINSLGCLNHQSHLSSWDNLQVTNNCFLA